MRGVVVFKVVGWVVFGAVAACVMGVVLGFPVMWLWNWLAPTMFHLPVIDFWQAVGLLVLSHLLFKSHGHGGGRWRHRHPHGRRWSRFAEEVQGSIRHGEEPAPAPGPSAG
jgi:hypothetical protein